jgi:histone deacetylase 1/2
MMTNRRVTYIHDEKVGLFSYGPHHPMKPFRITLTHDLIVNYGLFARMNAYRPPLATAEDMKLFHAPDYVDFLRTVTPETCVAMESDVLRFKLNSGKSGEDCPIFDGLFNYCQMVVGGSMCGAYHLNSKMADVAVNWSGGLHHAKKGTSSGFCYVNDIVMAILELLKFHQRVLYIDIDVHHGDGVEEAFLTTNRVMTISFHKYGNFFPGSGGGLRGLDKCPPEFRNYSLNFPLNEGIDDASFLQIFSTVISSVKEKFQPGVVVLQSGADSLFGDQIGVFNLSSRGHANCVDFVQKLGLPLLVLGGGGYTINNVARCWALETGVLLGEKMNEELPYCEFYDRYKDHKLLIPSGDMGNQNTREELERKTATLLGYLNELEQAPATSSPSVLVSARPTVQSRLAEKAKERADNADPDRRPRDRPTPHHSNSNQREFYDGPRDQDSSNTRPAFKREREEKEGSARSRSPPRRMKGRSSEAMDTN